MRASELEGSTVPMHEAESVWEGKTNTKLINRCLLGPAAPWLEPPNPDLVEF